MQVQEATFTQQNKSKKVQIDNLSQQLKHQSKCYGELSEQLQVRLCSVGANESHNYLKLSYSIYTHTCSSNDCIGELWAGEIDMTL